MYMEPASTWSPPPVFPAETCPNSDSRTWRDEATIKTGLERLSAISVDAIHAHDFDHIALQHWDETMRTSHDGIEMRLTREKMWADFVEYAAQTPGQRSEVLNVCAEVDARRGRGKVWLTTAVCGIPGGVRKEGVAVLSWERRDCGWVCYKHAGIGGVRGFT